MASKKKEEKFVESMDLTNAVSVSSDADVKFDGSVTTTSGNEDVSVVGVVEEKPKKRKKSPQKIEELAVQSQINELESKYEKVQESFTACVADNERLSDALKDAVDENKSLRKELSKSKTDYKKLLVESKANAELVNELHNEKVRMTNRIEELKSSIANMQANIKSYGDEIAEKDIKISELTLENGILGNLVDECHDMNAWRRFRFLFLGKRMFTKKGS